MYRLEMYKKKEPKRKTSIDFTQEAYNELQEFRKRFNSDASNSTIVNDLIMIFLNLPEEMKHPLAIECQKQIKRQKHLYATVTEQEDTDEIDKELERLQRLMAFLKPKY